MRIRGAGIELVGDKTSKRMQGMRTVLEVFRLRLWFRAPESRALMASVSGSRGDRASRPIRKCVESGRSIEALEKDAKQRL